MIFLYLLHERLGTIYCFEHKDMSRSLTHLNCYCIFLVAQETNSTLLPIGMAAFLDHTVPQTGMMRDRSRTLVGCSSRHGPPRLTTHIHHSIRSMRCITNYPCSNEVVVENAYTMLSSGFTNAPVTQFLVFGTVITAFLASITDTKYYFWIQARPHLFDYWQFCRLLTWQICYTNSTEVLFADMTFYHLRVVERLWGSRKFAVRKEQAVIA